MTRRLMLILIVIPIAIVLISLAVANRGMVPFTLDPFNPGNPALTINAPLFVYLFAAAGIGVLAGGFMTWLKQGRYRKLARERSKEAEAMRVKADGERAAREAAVAGKHGLPAPVGQ